MLTMLLRGTRTLYFCKPLIPVISESNKCLIHCSSSVLKERMFGEPKKWLTYNDKIFPVQKLEEERRPAYVCHMKTNIKYSPKKMWYIACFVRGMSIDEALQQLEYINKKGAAFVRDALLEAQELAVKEHNVEFKSNLWVAESFAGKAYTLKGMRRHARGRPGVIHYRYCHYFVRLEEGSPPPKDKYYWREPEDGDSLLQSWLNTMRQRKIISSL